MKWLQVLKEQVDIHGQKPVAAKLGVSNGTVSQLVNEKYPGDMAKMQALVESVYLDKTVNCPVLGRIGWHQCQANQKNEHTSNPLKLRLYRACRSGCEHSDLAITQNVQLQALANRGSALNYDANAVIGRLKLQVNTDGGNAAALSELLQAELIALATRFNRLNK